MCSIIHDVEWSGTLFYRHEGSLEDGTFKVTCVDLFVMDIGSSAYTEYDESPDVLTYRINHDLLGEDIQEGLIHSHNNMSTFFSGTDTNTLIDEGTNSNHFVSLIVNNEGTYTAGVTRKVTTETKAEAHIKYTGNKYYNSYGNEKIPIEEDCVKEEDREETKVTQTIEWFELEIEKAEVTNNFAEIDSRLAELRDSKRQKKSTSVFSNYKKYNGYNSYNIPTLNDREKVKTSESPANNSPKSPVIEFPPSPKTEIPKVPAYKERWNEYWDEYDDAWDNYYVKENTSKSKTPDPNDDEVPLCLTETFDEELTKSLALQLLTGSIIVNEKAIDPEKWVEKMDLIYEKRFGPLTTESFSVSVKEVSENNNRLEEWIDSMCEFLIHTKDEDLLSRLNTIAGQPGYYDESDTAEVCAGALCGYLGELPDSYVKDKMIECLTKYLPNGTEEYFVSKK